MADIDLTKCTEDGNMSFKGSKQGLHLHFNAVFDIKEFPFNWIEDEYEKDLYFEIFLKAVTS